MKRTSVLNVWWDKKILSKGIMSIWIHYIRVPIANLIPHKTLAPLDCQDRPQSIDWLTRFLLSRLSLGTLRFRIDGTLFTLHVFLMCSNFLLGNPIVTLVDLHIHIIWGSVIRLFLAK